MRILNSELADTFGNLLSRACAKTLNPHQQFPIIHTEQLGELVKLDSLKLLLERISEVPDKCHQHYTANSFHLVVDSVMTLLHAANNFFESTKPWELKKGNDEAIMKLETIISLTMESLRVSGIILQPIIPDFTHKLLQRLSIPHDQRFWKSTKLDLKKVSHNLTDLESNILFKRIILESEKKEKPQNKKQSLIH